MYKSILFGLTILLTLFVYPLQSFAHANLQGTTPGDGEVLSYSIDVITFDFSTDIKEGSTFTVTDANGQEVKVQPPEIDGQVMLGQMSEPLPSGNYTVTYEIISEDSHVVDGEYSFEIDAEPSEETSEEDEADVGSENPPANESSNSNGLRVVEDGLSPVVFITAGSFVLAGIGVLVWMMRKKGSA